MKPWIKWTLGLVAAALVVGGIARAISNRQAQQTQLAAQAERQKVQAAIVLQPSDQWTAKTTELSQTLPLSGTIKAVQSAVVKARVAGELQSLSVREGDRVQAGAVIARIDPTEYRARLDQAQQQADAAQAQVDIAKRTFVNNQALVQQGFISGTALESSASQLAATQASHRAAQAGVALAQKALDDTQLRAPLSGSVSQRLAQPGERVSVDARIVEIVDSHQLEMEASITAADAVPVGVGQWADISVEGIASPLRARVARINPSTTQASRSVLVYLTLDTANGLRHGQFAQGRLKVGSVQGVVVPLTAIRSDRPSPYVQTITNNQVAHVNVTLSSRSEVDGQKLVLVGGLEPGSQVLNGSIGAVRAGTPVQSAPAP